jgi:predicted Zn-dependent peptidase
MSRKKQHPCIHTINGYKVLFDQNSTNMLRVECVIKNGFCTETKSTSGINHLLEHIMVDSWKKCKKSCNTYWDNKGLYVNASTDNAEMKYYIKGLNTDAKDMVSYITHIVDNPFMTKSSVVREKQAVIDELLTYSSDPDSNADDVFNKEFYATEGSKYADDWKLQIHNLKHINLDDLRNIYTQYFNVQNIIFIVVGGFKLAEMQALFKKELTHPKQGINLQPKCFSFSHKIMYLKQNIENTKVRIVFPSNTSTPYIHISAFVNLLHILLFTELRSKLSLLYDISITKTTDSCGTIIFFEFDCRPTNVVRILVDLFKYIKNMQTHKLSNLDGFKKREAYDYLSNKKSMSSYYGSFVFSTEKLYGKKMLIHQINAISAENIMEMAKTLLNIDTALCLYESTHDLKLTWEKLI